MTSRLLGDLLPDPDVKGVDRLLAPDGVERFAREMRKLLQIEGSVILTVLKQRLGQRALIRVDIERQEDTVRLYAKLLRRSRQADEEQIDRLRRISEHAASVGITVPRPVGCLTRFRALIFGSAAGRSLLPCCAPKAAEPAESDAVPADRGKTFHSLGEALAGLHLRLPIASEVKTRDFERRQIFRARERMAENRPELLERFDEAERHWSRGDPSPPPGQADLVALHGDFYPAQVLVDPGPDPGRPRLAVLDWDAFCSGEAERDLGNFEAHLGLERLRGHLGSGEDSLLGHALREGYILRRTIDLPRLSWYRRGSLLRLSALYTDPEFGPDPPNRPTLAVTLLQAAETDQDAA